MNYIIENPDSVAFKSYNILTMNEFQFTLNLNVFVCALDLNSESLELSVCAPVDFVYPV